MDTTDVTSEAKFWAKTVQSILASLNGILEKLAKFSPWLRRWLNRPIIVAEEGGNWWHMGRMGDKRPAMQVVTRWHVTNPTDQPIRILNAFIVRPRTAGSVLLKDAGSNYFGSYAVPPQTTTELHADFWITPPITKEGRDIYVDIAFIDQFKQKRKLRAVKVPSDKKARRTPRKLESEAIGPLTDAIEKRVASVLQDEITRYKKYGRQQGLLGSVHADVNGKVIKQIYQDSWTSAKAGQRQEIAVDETNRQIRSDNGDALVKCYEALSEPQEREVFVNALLSRLNRRQEYYAISYFILYVLFRIGRLSDALDVANQTLPEKRAWIATLKEKLTGSDFVEVHQRFGYSDFFGLLNGMLRYEHESFTDADLDLVEKCVSETTEHTFAIPEKINSIRTLRLTSDGGKEEGLALVDR